MSGCSCASSHASAAATVCRARSRACARLLLLLCGAGHPGSCYFAVLTSGRSDSGSLRKSAALTRAGEIGAGPFSFSDASPRRAQQQLKKFDRILPVRRVLHQCDAPGDMRARNRDRACARGSSQSRQNHDRVLPVISVLRGVGHVDLIGQVHVAIVRDWSSPSPGHCVHRRTENRIACRERLPNPARNSPRAPADCYRGSEPCNKSSANWKIMGARYAPGSRNGFPPPIVTPGMVRISYHFATDFRPRRLRR